MESEKTVRKSGYVDVLRRGAASEPQEQPRVLTAARTELDRLSRLVDDLLTLARLGAGAPLHRQALDVPSLLSDAAQRARLLAPGRCVTVQCPSLLPPLPADPDRIRQVLNNLVTTHCVTQHPGRKLRWVPESKMPAPERS